MLNFLPSPLLEGEDLEDLKLPQETHNRYHWRGYLPLCVYAECRVFKGGKADLRAVAFFETYLTAHSDAPAGPLIRRLESPQL